MVHERGPRSRATITAETGLNRSTVADLVAELAARGLVSEQQPDRTHRVGRPSPIVSCREDVVAIGVNPEVDAVELAVVALGGRVCARERVEVTMPGVGEVAEIVARVVRAWGRRKRAGSVVVGIGVAVPGLVRAEDGLIRLAPHLGWRDADLAGPVEAATGLPVAVGNDASLGARAEHLFGAARDHDDIVYLNGGSSGIGGGLILHGRLIGGTGGYAGEWGQTAVALASVDVRRLDRVVLEDEVNRARLVEAAGLGAVDDAALAAALSRDVAEPAVAEIDRQRRILAAALGNAVTVLNPSKIVLGGFLAMLRDAAPERFDAAVRSGALAVSAERLEVASAALGADRLLIGAADAAFARLLSDPGADAPSADVAGYPSGGVMTE
ncbi:MAG: ROK family protein [Microbacterium sp.]